MRATIIQKGPRYNEALIIYMQQPARIKCDRNCRKAWGRNSRPEHPTYPDFVLPDDELGEAPEDPGTTEGNDKKPKHPDHFPNRWCIRECERCALSEPGLWHEELAVPNLNAKE